MPRRQSKALQYELRQRLAQESARLMIEHGIVDYGLAKRKAAENLSVAGRGGLPSNLQIEACLAERQRIFEPDGHADRLWQLRELALRLMRQLAGFEPRLTGPVLWGTATNNSRIELHVFASGAEDIGAALEGYGYRCSTGAKRYRFGGGRQIQVPAFRFQTDGALVLTPVFAENGIREAPLSSVDQRPMTRASERELKILLDSRALN
jgi:hypothetical protein